MAQNRRPQLALRASVVALHGALALFATGVQAQAPAGAQQAPQGPSMDDPAVQELVRPVNSIEAGVIGVDNPSAKFGEYNGLHREGARPLLDFEIRRGSAYQPETGGTERWRVYGRDLGLPVRSLGAEYSDQGSWRIGIDYDQLRRNFADDFLTLWGGAGTATLVLPPGYPAAATRGAAFNNIQNPAVATAIGNGLASHTLGTERRRLGLATEIVLSPRWTFSAGARNERKDGTKLTGIAFGGFRGALLPEPVDYETNILETALRYQRKDAHFALGYNVSYFNNAVDAWTAENPFQNNATFNNRVVMSGAPDNDMHQVTADGGWRFRPDTKVTVSAAYARMKQNERFNFQQGPGQNVNFGATSANAEQVQKNFLARLNHAVNRDFDLSAAARHEHRDTRTPVGVYAFSAADSPATPAVEGRTVNNLPQNRRQNTYSLDARYNLQPGRVITAGLEHMRIRRSFDAPTSQLVTQENPFLSNEADQNTVRAGYRHAFNEALSGQFSLSHSDRKGRDYFEFAPTSATPAPGVFPQNPAFRQFFLASREQDKVRASLDYQLSEALSLQGSVEHFQDRYPDSRYGLKKAGFTTWTIDSTYVASERLSFNGHLSFEDGETRAEHYNMAGGALPYTINPACPATPAPGSSSNIADPCREWSVAQNDRVFTFGFGAKSGHLAGRLTLSADIVHSRAKTNLDFAGGTYSGSPLRFVAAENMPAITSRLTDLRLGALYQLDKDSAVRVGYLYRRLKSSDPQFDLFGVTTVQAFIGPGMQSPHYHVHALGLSYVYTFR